MSYSHKFPVTLPIDITFFNAESLSPLKLNTIFNYLKMASSSTELYLGNGIDYDVTDDVKKKLICNISNLIGDVSGNIYMPYNHVKSIYTIYKNYCSTYGNSGVISENSTEHAIYNGETDSIEIIGNINIPISKMFNSQVVIGIHYSLSNDSSTNYTQMKCSVHSIATGADGDIAVETTVINNINLATISKNNNRILSHKNITLPADTFISHIEFNNNVQLTGTHLYIHSIYLIEQNGTAGIGPVFESLSGSTSANISTPLNSFYAIGKTHKTLYICKQPCKWSDSAYNSDLSQCPYRTLTSSCIGNTYDIFVDTGVSIGNKLGIPVCGGLYSGGNIDGTLITSPYSYSTAYNGGASPSHYVMQSPLLNYKNKQHSIKYVPISMSINTIGALESAEGYVYDLKSPGRSPILFDALLEGTDRPDIIQVKNKVLQSDLNRYIFISSDIGISQMINALLDMVSSTINRSVAIYAD